MSFSNYLIRKLNYIATFSLVAFFIFGFCLVPLAIASSTSNFQQTITVGTLSVDIVDDSYVTVGSPTVVMGSEVFDWACQTSTGTFGTATEQIYVVNPDAADAGWYITLKGSASTDVWDSAGTDYDFNDPTGSGCTDGGGDVDDVGGEMTVDASGGTLDVGQCTSCTTTNVTKGAPDSFEEGVTDEITLLTGAAGSDDIGDWTLETVSISQKIPAEQPVASDYDIDMTLSVYAS